MFYIKEYIRERKVEKKSAPLDHQNSVFSSFFLIEKPETQLYKSNQIIANPWCAHKN